MVAVPLNIFFTSIYFVLQLWLGLVGCVATAGPSCWGGWRAPPWQSYSGPRSAAHRQGATAYHHPYSSGRFTPEKHALSRTFSLGKSEVGDVAHTACISKFGPHSSFFPRTQYSQGLPKRTVVPSRVCQNNALRAHAFLRTPAFSRDQHYRHSVQVVVLYS